MKIENRENIEAVVFDMDGVIFDSERMCIECWKEIANRHNIPSIEEACHTCIGLNMKRTREVMFELYGEDFPYDEYSKEESALFHQRFDGGKLPKKPGIEELLIAIKKKGMKIALASSTRKAMVEQELTDGGLISYFDAIVGGDMVERSKPEPDIYLKACEVLKISPENAVAIEDSYNGIRSAYRAGLFPIMVPDLIGPDEEMQSLAGGICKSLDDVRQKWFV